METTAYGHIINIHNIIRIWTIIMIVEVVSQQQQ